MPTESFIVPATTFSWYWIIKFSFSVVTFIFDSRMVGNFLISSIISFFNSSGSLIWLRLTSEITLDLKSKNVNLDNSLLPISPIWF